MSRRRCVLTTAVALFLFTCVAYIAAQYKPPHAPVLLTTHGRDPFPPSKWSPQQPQDGVLFHEWEVLLLLPPNPENEAHEGDDRHLSCLFQDGSTSPASSSGALPWSRNSLIRCIMPPKARQSKSFLVPKLIIEPENDGVHSRKLLKELTETAPPDEGTTKELLRWNDLAYESLSTDTDVVVFAKGITNRQGAGRQPAALSCVFYHEGSSPSSPAAIRTPVTSSSQEIFRCQHPDPLALGSHKSITVTIEYKATGKAVPSIARYHGRSNQQAPADDRKPDQKSLICSCTMGYNIAKFLPEWATYHASIGVDRFFLYDNGSEDDLPGAISALGDKGINITSYLWPWPKSQEAGFSHCAALHRDSCTWMMYVDLDEFIFSPSWSSSPQPSRDMLPSLLPKAQSGGEDASVGQVMIWCQDFGPSGLTSHPTDGVTQGYTCRRRAMERHKSLVRLDAVDPSLRNVVHHFQITPEFSSSKVRPPTAAVYHYKYQAWPEFRNKFRRRVSAYVAEWTEHANAESKDRAPGLGFEAVEPQGWEGRFCEVQDTWLRDVTRKWFRMAGNDRLVWEFIP